jgi:hypothetical protein
MSQNFRTTLAYYATLIIGIFILCNQCYKYYLDTLELTFEESIVFAIGFMLVMKPTWLISFFNLKYGKTND